MVGDEILATIEQAGGGTIADLMRRTFSSMESAEEEIAAAKHRHPGKAAAIDGSFLRLQPPDILREFPLLVPAHQRQILDQIGRGDPRVRATPAMVCAVCAKQSLLTPPTRAWGAAYHHAFRECIPEKRDLASAHFTGWDLDEGRERMEEIVDKLTARYGSILNPKERKPQQEKLWNR